MSRRSEEGGAEVEEEEGRAPWEDPRLDPRLRGLMQFFASQRGTKVKGLDEVTKEWAELVRSANRNVDRLKAVEAANMAEHDSQLAVAPKAAVVRTDGTFASALGGNVVRYSFLRPATAPAGAVLPCIYYIHGGGMMSGSCFYSHYQAWGRVLAMRGFCVFLVDFRNSLMPGLVGGAHSSGEVAAYPGGLNDCVSGFRYLYDNAAAFGVAPDKLFVAGESGGANLALGMAMRLNKDGDISKVRGIYALCPYVLGVYPNKEFPSTETNNGIMLLLDGQAPHFYGIDSYRQQDPCAWPIFAKEEDLAGLPPTVVSCNECDPLLDEGLQMYRKLRDAGVQTQARIVVGTCHGAELFFLMPEVTKSTANNMAFFIHETLAAGETARARL